MGAGWASGWCWGRSRRSGTSPIGERSSRSKGTRSRSTCCRFHPDGDLVLTCSWDGTARLWDAGTGRSVVHWQSLVGDPHFGRDGRACGVVKVGGETRLLEVEPRREYRTLVAGLGLGTERILPGRHQPGRPAGRRDGGRRAALGAGHRAENWPSCRSAGASRRASSPGSGAASCSRAAPAGSTAGRLSRRRARARPPPDRDAQEGPTADGADDGRGRA